jgi:hypothetical protein
MKTANGVTKSIKVRKREKRRKESDLILHHPLLIDHSKLVQNP